MFRRKPVDEHTGPLAEFVALRAEILHLGEQQWKATAFLITTTGAVFGFALSLPGRIPLLLIVPFPIRLGRLLDHPRGGPGVR
ncbi:hypothetical protein [Amycolatopsis sp. NPDC051128]|uniref:hypothetical protein n=1 Tax=Amycolatopsis sp. NPDC051128 TaxID=3155412 RepID=UPI003436CC69